MKVLAEAVRLVILPLSFVNVTIGVDEAAAAICFVVAPVTLIE